MSLNKPGSYALQHAPSVCPAYLIKLPITVWEQIEAAIREGEDISLSHEDIMTLDIGQSSVPLETSGGAPTEVHRVSDSNLVHLAQAATRLTVPLTSASKRADSRPRDKRTLASKAKSPTPATLPTTPTSHTVNNGYRASRSPPPQANGAVVPLKTRVMQALALGSATVEELVRRTGAVEADVMRVVRVVGRSTAPSSWELQPSQYSKIKLQGTTYTASQLDRMQGFATSAFEELGLPPDAEERAAFTERLREARLSATSSPSSEASGSKERGQPVKQDRDKPNLKDEATAPQEENSPARTINRAVANGKDKKANSSRTGSVKGSVNAAISSPARRDAGTRVAAMKTADEPSSKTQRPSTTSHAISHAAMDKQNKPAKDDGVSILPNITKKKRASEPPQKAVARASVRDYSSSSSSDDESDGTERPGRKRARKRRDAIRDAPDPEALRDRYEELFPAYQLLTEKLAALHQQAEQTDHEHLENLTVKSEDLRKMVAKWERWHAELSGIRRWFQEEA